jgi:hypothetical protein
MTDPLAALADARGRLRADGCGFTTVSELLGA